MKEKPLELQRCFVPHLGGPNMISKTGPVFSLRELSTDLKNRFSLLKSWKPLDFVVKHYINIIYMKLRLFVYFRSETRILKE